MRHVSAYMCRVDYRVLGALQAGPDPTVLRGQRGRDVLALLLTRRGRPLSPELILDAVWENDAVRLDASVVHTVISPRRSPGTTPAISLPPRPASTLTSSPDW